MKSSSRHKAPRSGMSKKKAPKGAPTTAAPKGPTRRKQVRKSTERLIIADIQDAFDAIWQARKTPARARR